MTAPTAAHCVNGNSISPFVEFLNTGIMLWFIFSFYNFGGHKKQNNNNNNSNSNNNALIKWNGKEGKRQEDRRWQRQKSREDENRIEEKR